MVPRDSKYRSLGLTTILLILLLGGGMGCLSPDDSECTSDEDCNSEQRCASAGGLLSRGGVCVDLNFGTDVGGDADVPIDDECIHFRPLGSELMEPAAVSTLFTVEDCHTGAPRPDLDSDDFVITEDGDPLTESETHRYITERAHRAYVTLLLDMSDQDDGERETVLAGATDFVNQLLEERAANHAVVGIQLFDGSSTTTVWQPPLADGAALKERLAEISSDFEGEQGDQANLNGAIVDGVEGLQDRLQQAQHTSGGGLLPSGYLVVFSANRDSQQHQSTASVRAVVDEAAHVDMERQDRLPFVRTRAVALKSNEAHIADLEQIVDDRLLTVAMQSDELSQSFLALADDLADELASTYQMAHCSSILDGHYELGVTVSTEAVQPLAVPVNAEGFQSGCDVDFLHGECDENDCGGAWCGGCDDRREVCDTSGSSGRCVDYCQAGEQCLEGMVDNPMGHQQSCELDEDFDSCESQCVDTGSNAQHCGECGNYCPSEIACIQGQCDCPGDQIGCVGECVDSTAHDAHCGACGQACEVRCRNSDCIAVSQVSTGEFHSCAILDDGSAECWGNNEHGQLGGGQVGATTSQPVPVQGLDEVIEIAAGWHHSCAIDSDQEVKCWGHNQYGQLGDGSEDDRDTAVSIDHSQFGEGEVVVQLSLGEFHSCARTSEDQLYCWGRNDRGQLGVDSSIDGHSTPVRIQGVSPDDIVDVVSGASHNCAIVSDPLFVDDDLYCWGRNNNGQIGNGDTEDVFGPTEIEELEGIDAVSAGRSHSCGLVDDQVYCWGRTDSGRLGSTMDFQSLNQPTPVEVEGLSDVITIVSGGRTNCAIDVESDHYCWGSNANGELGDQDDIVNVPVRVDDLAQFDATSMGGSHICALSSSGIVHCRGRNNTDQLGDGSGQSQSSFVPVEWH